MIKYFISIFIIIVGCAKLKPDYEYTFDENIDDLKRVACYSPWAIKLDQSVVRSGKSSIRFEVRDSDYRINKKGEKSSRAELSTQKPTLIGKEYWYGFSLFIPSDFPIEDNRLVIGQWWAPPDKTEVNRSPALALRFSGLRVRQWVAIG